MIDYSLASQIYETLVNRRFRQGPRPDARKESIISQIAGRPEGNTVELLLGWGGYKNPNLDFNRADFAEQATLGQLNRLNEAVKKVYSPGMRIHIVLSGRRAERVNRMPHADTLEYQQSLQELLDSCSNQFIDMTPISCLYDRYSAELEPKIAEVRERLALILPSEPFFNTLVLHARSNVYLKGADSSEHDELCRNAAIDYIIFKVAEDEANIYRDYSQSVKSAFCYPAMGHARYVRGELIPPRDCNLSFYTTRQGDKVQPWQAIGAVIDCRVVCMTKKRIEKMRVFDSACR